MKLLIRYHKFTTTAFDYLPNLTSYKTVSIIRWFLYIILRTHFTLVNYTMLSVKIVLVKQDRLFNSHDNKNIMYTVFT